jgi:hypothetical protein
MLLLLLWPRCLCFCFCFALLLLLLSLWRRCLACLFIRLPEYAHAFPHFCMRSAAAQGKAAANNIFSSQMLPATFVVNKDGREACFCPFPEDTDGLYVLFFNQGTSHGSKKICTDASQLGETVLLPVLFSPENMSDAMLKTQMLRHMQALNAVVVAVECSKEVRDDLCRAWQWDLDSLGGNVPSGSPNSSKVGILRSNGLPFGTFATSIRAHAELRRCWRLLAIALNRDDPFPAPPRGASQPAVISSFDASCTPSPLTATQA